MGQRLKTTGRWHPHAEPVEQAKADNLFKWNKTLCSWSNNQETLLTKLLSLFAILIDSHIAQRAINENKLLNLQQPELPHGSLIMSSDSQWSLFHRKAQFSWMQQNRLWWESLNFTLTPFIFKWLHPAHDTSWVISRWYYQSNWI